MRASNSGEKDTFTHQHGPGGSPVVLAISMAHAFG
jgi:hypothetical protein